MKIDRSKIKAKRINDTTADYSYCHNGKCVAERHFNNTPLRKKDIEEMEKALSTADYS